MSEENRLGKDYMIASVSFASLSLGSATTIILCSAVSSIQRRNELLLVDKIGIVSIATSVICAYLSRLYFNKVQSVFDNER